MNQNYQSLSLVQRGGNFQDVKSRVAAQLNNSGGHSINLTRKGSTGLPFGVATSTKGSSRTLLSTTSGSFDSDRQFQPGEGSSRNMPSYNPPTQEERRLTDISKNQKSVSTDDVIKKKNPVSQIFNMFSRKPKSKLSMNQSFSEPSVREFVQKRSVDETAFDAARRSPENVPISGTANPRLSNQFSPRSRVSLEFERQQRKLGLDSNKKKRKKKKKKKRKLKAEKQNEPELSVADQIRSERGMEPPPLPPREEEESDILTPQSKMTSIGDEFRQIRGDKPPPLPLRETQLPSLPSRAAKDTPPLPYRGGSKNYIMKQKSNTDDWDDEPRLKINRTEVFSNAPRRTNAKPNRPNVQSKFIHSRRVSADPEPVRRKPNASKVPSPYDNIKTRYKKPNTSNAPMQPGVGFGKMSYFRPLTAGSLSVQRKGAEYIRDGIESKPPPLPARSKNTEQSLFSDSQGSSYPPGLGYSRDLKGSQSI
eukprot:augustus_masked-scaffold_23-processed-gene-5.56-mRNA-1 protein AED:1.00 eAED:1.00 QI:0/-1/0/0/-1/1/1/0/477